MIAAAPKTPMQGSLIRSEETYDTQLKSIVQGVNKLIGGCEFTNKAHTVIVLDLNVLSASKVQLIKNDTTICAAHESISN